MLDIQVLFQVIFMGTLTAGGLKVQWDGTKLLIANEVPTLSKTRSSHTDFRDWWPDIRANIGPRADQLRGFEPRS